MTDNSASKRKILVVSPFVPYPPDRGHRVRIYYHLRQIMKEFRVGLVTQAFSETEMKHALELKRELPELKPMAVQLAETHVSLPHRAVASVVSRGGELGGRPRERYYHSSKKMRLAVTKICREFEPDLILVHYWFARWAIPDGIDVPLWIDSVDLHWRREQRAAMVTHNAIARAWFSHRAALIEKNEIEAYRSANRVLVVQKEEAEDLAPRITPVPVSTLPISTEIPGNPSSRKPGKMVAFLGAMDYLPNRDAVLYMVEDVMPLVRKIEPTCSLKVIGFLGKGRHLPNKKWIRYTGFLSSIEEEIGDVAVAVAPLRIGAGTSVKVLTILGLGIPLVATRRAVAGLELEDGRDYLQADSPQATADAILSLMENEALANRIGSLGFDYAQRRFHWESSTPEVLKVYKRGLE